MNLTRYYGKHKPMCAICSQKGLLLCCDYCPLAYHPECLSPPLKCQPPDFWACPRCEYHAKTAERSGQTPIDPPVASKLHVGSGFPLKPAHSRFISHSQIISRGENGRTRLHIFTSGYRGVYSRAGKWNAQIQYNGKKVYLGSYSSEEEAAHAYDIAAKRYHGSKAILNFHTEDGASCRNPLQVNSKPTSRQNSIVSAASDPCESNREVNSVSSRIQSIDTELHACSPIIYVDTTERRNVLRCNREQYQLFCRSLEY